MTTKWTRLKEQPWFLPASGVVAALLLAGIIQGSASSHGPERVDFDLDTHIPQGHVLVPIQVHNSENVDSMFGTYGMVDLYPVSENGKASREAILRGVKMLRAPRNPNQFGVLVPTDMAATVIRSGGTFAAVVLNRQSRGTVLEKQTPRTKRKIILEPEEH